MILTPERLDVLKESFNMGVGEAALALSELGGGQSEVALSVPEVSMVSFKELAQQIAAESGEQVCGVFEDYEGAFSGTAGLIYAEDESLDLVRLILGEDMPLETFSEMATDALREVGNLLLNSCLSTLANLFDAEIVTQLPRIVTDTHESVLRAFCGETTDTQLLYLRMNFTLEEHELSGHIGFSLEGLALGGLLECIDRYIERMLGT